MLRNFIIVIVAVVIGYYFYLANLNMSSESSLKHIPKTDRVALVAGATGATGSQILKQLLESDEWSKVYTIGRREVDEKSPKLVNIIVKDLKSDLEGTKEQWTDVQTVFNAIGTTRASAGSGEKFVEIEVGISEALSKAAKENGVQHMLVVSAQGANANMWGPLWFHGLLYMKTMGEKEQASLKQKFKRTTIMQPGMLERLRNDRSGESFFKNFVSGLDVTLLAKAMIKDATSVDFQNKDKGDGDGEDVVKYYTGNPLIEKLAK